MADEFTCNFCGKLTDTGYFYCEKCHRIHKDQKGRDEDKNKCGNATKDIFKSAIEKPREKAASMNLNVESD